MNIKSSQIIIKTAYICDLHFIHKDVFFCYQTGAIKHCHHQSNMQTTWITVLTETRTQPLSHTDISLMEFSVKRGREIFEKMSSGKEHNINTEG